MGRRARRLEHLFEEQMAGGVVEGERREEPSALLSWTAVGVEEEKIMCWPQALDPSVACDGPRCRMRTVPSCWPMWFFPPFFVTKTSSDVRLFLLPSVDKMNFKAASSEIV